MALEDLTGSRTIDSLDRNNPVGSTDFIDKGDEHIRGQKNVILNTFPNITGPITLTHTQINNLINGEFPSGTQLIFFQASAPIGWTQNVSHNNRMLRVVSTAGGGFGGAHSPILMDLVPPHTHFIAGVTDVENAPHTHGVNYTNGSGGSPGSGVPLTDFGPGSDFQTGTESAFHAHTFTTFSNVNGGSSNYLPFYMDVIIASKN